MEQIFIYTCNEYDNKSSLTSIQLSTMRMLAIFLWRQAISPLIWPDQAIIIKIKPYINWKSEPEYERRKLITYADDKKIKTKK